MPLCLSGKRGFASAAAVQFATPVTHAAEVLEPESRLSDVGSNSDADEPSSSLSESSDDRRKSRKHGHKKKRDRRHKKKHRKQRSGSPENAHVVTELDGVFIVDRFPDRESVR